MKKVALFSTFCLVTLAAAIMSFAPASDEAVAAEADLLQSCNEMIVEPLDDQGSCVLVKVCQNNVGTLPSVGSTFWMANPGSYGFTTGARYKINFSLEFTPVQCTIGEANYRIDCASYYSIGGC